MCVFFIFHLILFFLVCTLIWVFGNVSITLHIFFVQFFSFSHWFFVLYRTAGFAYVANTADTRAGKILPLKIPSPLTYIISLSVPQLFFLRLITTSISFFFSYSPSIRVVFWFASLYTSLHLCSPLFSFSPFLPFSSSPPLLFSFSPFLHFPFSPLLLSSSPFLLYSSPISIVSRRDSTQSLYRQKSIRPWRNSTYRWIRSVLTTWFHTGECWKGTDQYIWFSQVPHTFLLFSSIYLSSLFLFLFFYLLL